MTEFLATIVARFICGLFIWTFGAAVLALLYCQFNVCMKWRAWRQRRAVK